MTINKYTGKTEEEAKEKAREALGSNAIIMNVKVLKPKGLAGIFKSSTYEITAAIEDDGDTDDVKTFANTKSPIPTPKAGSFEAVADEDAMLLKDAFSAVNEVLVKQSDSSADDKTKEKKLEIENDINSKKQDTDEAVFEPLSDTTPRAKIISPTYSRPQGVASQQAKKHDIKMDSIPVEELNSKTKDTNTFDDKLSINNDNHVFVKMLYNVLLDNEVQEKYINQVLEDMDKVLQTSHSLDNLLSSVYQKMVLKLGAPAKITVGERRPKVVFFIGPTGVGKTTTIAKIASKFKLEGKKVGLITADTYRMAAANQLQTYANILGVPLNVIYSPDELLDTVKKQSRENDELEVIFVDTIGFSHRNEEQRIDTKRLVSALEGIYESEVYLVLSATTKHKDLVDIVNSYMEFTQFNLIFTKLDETKCLGNIFNIKLQTGASLSYITTGQNVPDDIELVNAQRLVKQLLGGS